MQMMQNEDVELWRGTLVRRLCMATSEKEEKSCLGGVDRLA